MLHMQNAPPQEESSISQWLKTGSSFSFHQSCTISERIWRYSSCKTEIDKDTNEASWPWIEILGAVVLVLPWVKLRKFFLSSILLHLLRVNAYIITTCYSLIQAARLRSKTLHCISSHWSEITVATPFVEIHFFKRAKMFAKTIAKNLCSSYAL